MLGVEELVELWCERGVCIFHHQIELWIQLATKLWNVNMFSTLFLHCSLTNDLCVFWVQYEMCSLHFVDCPCTLHFFCELCYLNLMELGIWSMGFGLRLTVMHIIMFITLYRLSMHFLCACWLFFKFSGVSWISD